MRVILRQVLILAAFVGGWLLLLAALSFTGVKVRYVEAFLARFVHGPSKSDGADAPPAKSQDPGAAELIPDDLRLLLPPRMYAIPGTEMSIYFENVVMTRFPDQLRFEVECDLAAQSERRRWTVTPTAKDVGKHTVHITIKDWRGKKVLTEGTTTMVVAPPDAAASKSLRMLIVGDSLTHSTHHINAFVRRLAAAGSPDWKLLGTHVPTNGNPALSYVEVAPGVRHEGYGGWTWNCFCTYNDPGNRRRHRERSPFLYPAADGSLQLNVAQYVREHCDGQAPDVVLFELGPNDVFCLQPDVPGQLETAFPKVLADADKLIAAFRKAAPRTALVVMLPPPLTASERIYQDAYAPEFNRWREKRILHRYLEASSKHFNGREKEGIYTIPAFPNFDVIDGYPVNDAAHPNEFGCKQIAASMHAWLVWWYAEQDHQRHVESRLHSMP